MDDLAAEVPAVVGEGCGDAQGAGKCPGQWAGIKLDRRAVGHEIDPIGILNKQHADAGRCCGDGLRGGVLGASKRKQQGEEANTKD